MDPWQERGATIDGGIVYERARGRFVITVGDLQPNQAATPVPATPAWKVGDVLAHVVGLATDLNAQRFPDGVDVDGAMWTARQVSERSAASIADIVAEWDREAPVFEEGLRLFGYEEGSHFVADLHAHHQDVRGALGLSRDEDPITIAVSLHHYLGFEVLRTFSARRSERQVRQMRWEGDLGSLLTMLRSQFSGGYSLPETDLAE